MRLLPVLITGAFLMQPNADEKSSRSTVEYLSGAWHRMVALEQGWGELGTDTAAHLPGREGLPLRIGDRTYERGLGHHAPGEIVFDLGGEYETFEAEVGVQWQGGGPGSVVFSVFVDGEKRFGSGVMRENDPSRPVRVPVAGARVLRLVVSDAGDGITCDCADWADARLIRSAAVPLVGSPPAFDIAPFARIVTWHPGRMDGAGANRVQEFIEADLFLETPVPRDSDGACTVPVGRGGLGSIGLQWLERRRLKELAAEFAGDPPPGREEVQVQAWFGESVWQGSWKPLPGRLQQKESTWRFLIDWEGFREASVGTEKVRWVFPPSDEPVRLRRLSARSTGIWEPVELSLEKAGATSGQTLVIEVYNGQFLAPDASGSLALKWNPSVPVDLDVLSNRPLGRRTERTVLRFRSPDGGFGVAVDDVVEHGAVHVPHAGVFVSHRPKNITLARYLREHASGQTILERTRRLPDQTFSQAIAKVHNPAQNQAPTMLSLACDNEKVIVGRAGDIRYGKMAFTPRFGAGNNLDLSRKLDGDWLPVPVTTVEEAGAVYRSRCFVAPFVRSPEPIRSPWSAGGPLFVADYRIRNSSDESVPVSLRLAIEADVDRHLPAGLIPKGGGFLVTRDAIPRASISIAALAGLEASTREGTLTLEGTLLPGQDARMILYVPCWETTAEEMQRFPRSEPLFRDTVAYWERIMQSATQVEVPDPLLRNVILASQVHCLIAARSEENGRRVAPWIASVSYGPLESEANSIIRGMDFLGHHEFARRSLEFFIHRYSPEGFLTTGYTLMGTGWHLWTLGEHVDLTGDTEWFAKVAPDVLRACDWVIRQRRKTMKVDVLGQRPREYGLIPPGVMADWNAFRYYFCLNGYYAAGLDAAGRALAMIDDASASVLAAEADAFRKEILRAYRATQADMPVVPLRNGDWVPGYPTRVHGPGLTRDFFPGEDANRSWCYDVELGAHHLVPQGVLDPTSREVGWMMDHMEDVHFLSDGWFDFPAERSGQDPFSFGGFAKVQPYYCRNAEVYALRDDVKAFIRSYFNTIPSLLNMENLSFQEHFHGAGAWNKTHETGYFLYQTRTMLLTEREAEIWLAPFVTSQWMRDGMTLAVRRAPTRFGPLSYRIRSHVADGFVEAHVEPPAPSQPDRPRRPARIVLRLRHPEEKPMRRVLLNGTRHTEFDPERDVIAVTYTGAPFTVRAEY